jgi:hypothetical protein
MRWRTVLVAALVLLPALAFAGPKKKKASIPAIFGTAQYVYVTAEAGDLYNPNLLPEDRDAISNVMNALHDWGRYIVMPTASGSELVFIVRKGRVASADVAGGAINPRTGPYGSPGAGPNSAPQSGPNSSPGTGPTGAQSQVPDDFMEVRLRQPDGSLSGPIWEHSMTDGLDAPRVLLLDQLKRSVEKDYPQK